MQLIYPNSIFADIRKKKKTKKNNSKNGYRKKQKLRSKERNRQRDIKYSSYRIETGVDDISIHSKEYEYNNESRTLVFTNPDLMNLIMKYLGFYSFIYLSMVSRSLNLLIKN